MLDFWSEHVAEKLDSNWGGYIISSGAAVKVTNSTDPQKNMVVLNGTLFMSLLHVGGWEDALPTITTLWGFHPEWMFFRLAINYTSFWEYEKNTYDAVGVRTYIINRLLQKEDLEPSSGLSQTLVNMVNYKSDIGCAWTLLGGEP